MSFDNAIIIYLDDVGGVCVTMFVYASLTPPNYDVITFWGVNVVNQFSAAVNRTQLNIYLEEKKVFTLLLTMQAT